MTFRRSKSNSWRDEPSDDALNEDPDEADIAKYGGNEWGDDTIPCPWCNNPVYEDAERCPDCGRFLSREDAPRRTSLWMKIGMVVMAMSVLMFVFIWLASGPQGPN